MSAYEITKITSQEELLLAVKEEKPVIEITGELYNSILAAAKEQMKGIKDGVVGISISYAVAAVAEIINPFISLPLILYGTKKGLSGGIHTLSSSKKLGKQMGTKAGKYCLYLHPSASQIDSPVFLLITKKFDLKHDSIVERPTCCFYDKKCLHCGDKMKDFDGKFKANALPSCCEKCKRPIFYKLA